MSQSSIVASIFPHDMPKGPWWILPVVVIIPVIIVINVLLFALLPIRSEELLSAEGLFLNICGAIITLIPDVVGIDKLFEPTEKINRIEEAQDKLFLDGNMKEEYGKQDYHKIVDILSIGRDNREVPDRIAAMTGGFGVSADVYFQYEKDKSDIDTEDPNTWQRYNNVNIGPVGVMDSRVSEYINELRSRGHQLGFALGIVLLLIGFVFQFVATV